MASSSIALRRVSSTLFNKLRPVSSTRSFNTHAQMRNYGDTDEDERNHVDTNRRSDSVSHRRPTFFPADVLDPLSPTRSLSQVLNMMEQLMENAACRRGGSGGALRRGWNAEEDGNGLYLRIDMPGLGKEHVKVSVEQNTLTIKGEADKEEDESSRRYSSRIELPEKVYKTDEIKAEMKNGVLKVLVPKVKKEARKDVFQVNVD